MKIDWVADLNDPLIRDYIDRARFERLLQSKGIKKDMTIVFYGDKNNRWATYGGAVHSYKAGDSFLEVVNTWHNGKNKGKTPAKVLVVS